MPDFDQKLERATDRIDAKLDKLDDRIDSLSQSFVRHQTLLEAHIENERSEEVKVSDRLGTIHETLLKQQDILDEHVRRTNLLEGRIEADKAVSEERIKNLKTGAKILGIVLGLGGGGFGLTELISAIAKAWGGGD
jgi:hypothetical protein